MSTKIIYFFLNVFLNESFKIHTVCVTNKLILRETPCGLNAVFLFNIVSNNRKIVNCMRNHVETMSRRSTIGRLVIVV